MGTPNQPKQFILFNDEVGAAETAVSNIDLGKIRIHKIQAVAEETQAAHATILLEVKVGTPADPDRYAHLTNDSDLTSDPVTDPDGVIVSSAWTAKTAKTIDFSAKTVGNAPNAAAPGTPGGSYPEHSGILETTIAKSGTTPAAGRVQVTLFYYDSD